MPLIQTLPAAERPRERMLAMGAHALGEDELLALVLGTGRGSGEDALELARRVLSELGGLEALAGAGLPALVEIRGIGPVKACRIRAAVELTLRAGPVEPPFFDEPGWVPLEDESGARPALAARGVAERVAQAMSEDPGPSVKSPKRRTAPEFEPGAPRSPDRGPTEPAPAAPPPPAPPVEPLPPDAATGLTSATRTLAPAPPTPAPAPPSGGANAVIHETITRLRGQVPSGSRALLAHRPGTVEAPVTLESGGSLSAQSRPGALLVGLLAAGSGPWWVASLRPGGPPRAAERAAATRLWRAAAVVGVDLVEVVHLGTTGAWQMGENGEVTPCGA